MFRHRVKVSIMLSILVCVFPSYSYALPDEPVLAFAVMSDIHIYKRNVDVHNRFIRALQDYRKVNGQLDLLVINGDLTNGFPSHYRTLKAILDLNPHPNIHFTLGNHEFYRMLYNARGEKDIRRYPNGWSNQKALRLFTTFTGYEKPYYDTWVKGYHFIFLANEKYSRATGKNGNMSNAQLRWLEDKLKERRSHEKKPVFVFAHHPLPNTVDGSQYDVNIVQHKQLKRILKRHPEVIFFSGHTHYNLRETRQHYFDTFLTLGSSSVKRNEESLYVEVYRDHLRVYGRDHKRGQWIPQASFRYMFHF